MIRKASVRNQTYSLTTAFTRDDDTYFKDYVSLIIRRTFPHARRSLCEQLALSITIRRKRLLRLVQHEEKLKIRGTRSQISTNQAHSKSIKPSKLSWFKSLPFLKPARLPHNIEGRIISTASVDTRSKLNVEMADRIIKKGPALSAISMGSSVSPSARKYPPRPYFPPGATDCACPYCSQRLSSAKLNRNPKFWE